MLTGRCSRSSSGDGIYEVGRNALMPSPVADPHIWFIDLPVNTPEDTPFSRYWPTTRVPVKASVM